MAVQLHKVSQLLLQNQSAKISVNGTFWTVFSMKTNISSLQSLPGVQQQKKGPSQMAFAHAPHKCTPTAIIAGMHHIMVLTWKPLHIEDHWSSSQLTLVGTACVVLHACCGLQDMLCMALGHRTTFASSW